MGDPLTEKIIGAAIEAHRIFGPGLLEGVYEDALCHELSLRDIAFQRQVSIDMEYKGHPIRQQILDLLVAGEVVVEIKALQRLPEFALAQLLSYLRAAQLKRGLLINFGESRLIDGVQRVSL